jgi:hypothetical protein
MFGIKRNRAMTGRLRAKKAYAFAKSPKSISKKIGGGKMVTAIAMPMKPMMPPKGMAGTMKAKAMKPMMKAPIKAVRKKI